MRTTSKLAILCATLAACLVDPAIYTHADLPSENCGNGILDPDEECDHGAQNSDSSACLPSCRLATCGDGHIDCSEVSPPRLSLPTQVLADATSTAGAEVTYAASAINDHDGPVPVTCTPPVGQFAVSTTTVMCSASNYVGNVAHGSFPVTVSYRWSNVLEPLHATELNRINRGCVVPVKFALEGGSAGIQDLVARLFTVAVIDGVPGPEQPAMSQSGDDNRFQYDPATHKYVLNWSTADLSSGNYQLRIDLGDGVSNLVRVELK